MTWRLRYLTESNFISTTSQAWSLALHSLFCFSQEKPLRLKEISTHTHTVSKFLATLSKNYHLSNLGLRLKVNKAHIIYIAILPWPDQAWEILRFFQFWKIMLDLTSNDSILTLRVGGSWTRPNYDDELTSLWAKRWNCFKFSEPKTCLLPFIFFKKEYFTDGWTSYKQRCK